MNTTESCARVDVNVTTSGKFTVDKGTFEWLMIV